MKNKKMKKFTAVAAALTVAAATLITGIGATLTAKEVSWTAEKPSGAPALANFNKDMAGGLSFTIKAEGVNGWLSSDAGVAAVSSGTVSLNAPGLVRIVRGTAQGDLTSNLYLIADSSKAASYKITKNQSNLKKAGDTDTIPITMKDGKDKTITGQVAWSSDDTSVATVGEKDGLITAVAKNGIANITGKFTDMYGQSQDIHYAAVVGDNVESTLIGPDDNGDYSKPTGDQDVYEKVDKDGNSKNPPEYIYDPDHNMSDGSAPNGDEQKMTPITDSMKNTVPSAEEFDNTKEGYLTDDEKNAYEEAIKQGTVVPATGITLGTPASSTLKVGDTQEAPSVTVQPTNATATTVEWSSSDKSVVMVDPTTGKVTAVGEGTVTITATITNADESKVTKSYELTVNAKISTDPDKTSWKVVKTTTSGEKTYALVTTSFLQDESIFGVDSTYAGSTLETWMKNWSNSHVYNTSTGTKYLIKAGDTTGTFVAATVPATGDSIPKDSTEAYQYAFALSSDEVIEGIFTDSFEARRCKFIDGHSLKVPEWTNMDGYSYYWLRTPSSSIGNYIVNGFGVVDYFNATQYGLGVRPACWIEVQ